MTAQFSTEFIMLQLIGSSSQETSDEERQFSFSASHYFLKTTTILTNQSCLLFQKTDQLSKKTFSVSSEVSNYWLQFSFGVYNLQHVQADNSFSSHELLNSRRDCNNRWRDCFGSNFCYFIFQVNYQAVTRNENKKKLNVILCICISLRGDLYPMFLFEF